MTGQVIAITGGKGGVGKSTTTINLGVSLRMDGYSVALVDADVEMPNLMEMLGIQADNTIHDVLSGTANTAEAIVEIGDGFAAIPGDSALSGYGSIEPERLHNVVDTLAANYEFVLLDTGAGLSYDDLFPIGLADEIILVLSPDAAAVENAKRTQTFVRMLNRELRGIVVTKVDSEVDDALVAEFDTELLGVIPDQAVVSRSTAEGKPLELIAPESPAAEAYRQLEANVTNGQLPPRRSVKSDTDAQSADGTDDEEQPDEPARADPADDEAASEDAERDREGPKKGGLFGRIASFVT